MLREALLLIAFSLVGAVGTHFFHPRAPAWYLVEAPLAEDEVSMAVIAEKWNSDVFWIDARIAGQFDQQHVPGAVSLNEQNFDQALFELYEEGRISYEDALRYADSVNDLRLMIKLHSKDAKSKDMSAGIEHLNIV